MEKAYRHVFKGPMDAHFYGSMVEIHVPANQQLDKKMAKKFARRLGGYKECQEEIRFCYNNGCAMSDVNVNFTFKY